MLLSYWSTDLDLEIAPWFPLGVDYQPVSINFMCGSRLKIDRIARSCLELDSELLLITSPRFGCAGSFVRDNFYRPDRSLLTQGLLVMLAYSPAMERAVINFKFDGVSAGLTGCRLWSDGLMLAKIKVIVLASEQQFSDEDNFIKAFDELLGQRGDWNDGSAFFAERFGYCRFAVQHEGENIISTRISGLLADMEFDETRQAVGPSPLRPLPELVDLPLDDGEDESD